MDFQLLVPVVLDFEDDLPVIARGAQDLPKESQVGPPDEWGRH